MPFFAHSFCKPALKAGLYLLMLTQASSASAAIYQCKDEDDRTVFSDQPCGGGINKALPDYEIRLEPYVSGRFTVGEKSFPVRQGVATWNEDEQNLQLVLTMRQLSATARQQAISGDWSFLDDHKAHGAVIIELALAGASMAINQVKAMTVAIHHDALKGPQPYKATLGGDDIIGHINRLKVIAKEDTDWVEFSTQEFQPELRWNISLVLPLVR